MLALGIIVFIIFFSVYILFEQRINSLPKYAKIFLKALSIGVTISFITIMALTFKGNHPNLPELFTILSWRYYNDHEYDKAINSSKLFIKIFRYKADEQQTELSLSNAPLPGVGQVSEGEARLILRRGVLNDVATCLYIAGKSFEKTERIGEAKRMYRDASRYTYARTWDQRGFFWSPAIDAQDKLNLLEK